LGKELSQKTVGVFVGAALPAVIGPGEITAHLQALFQWLKAGEGKNGELLLFGSKVHK